MRKPAYALLVLAAGVLGAASAWPQAMMEAFETGVEASTGYVSLPSLPTGSWRLTPCPTCTTHQVTLDAATQFFVGKTVVPLETLRQYAARGPQSLDVYYETKTRRVTRVVLRAEMDANRSTTPAPRTRRAGA